MTYIDGLSSSCVIVVVWQAILHTHALFDFSVLVYIYMLFEERVCVHKYVLVCCVCVCEPFFFSFVVVCVFFLFSSFFSYFVYSACFAVCMCALCVRGAACVCV